MKDEIETLLNNQSEWQKGRSALLWSEKLRQSVNLRNAGIALRAGYHVDERVGRVAEEQAKYGDK